MLDLGPPIIGLSREDRSKLAGTGINVKCGDLTSSLMGDPVVLTEDVGEVIDYNAERARAEKGRADKLELDNAERLKKLLPADEVEKAWVTMITNAKTKLTSLPSKVSALTDDPDERRRIFTEAKTIVDESLLELARGK